MAIVAIGLFGLIVMSLWNWLMPAIFSLHTITYWQALGLLILAKIFFGGFRGGPGGMRRHMRENWEHLTPEERAKFRDAIRKRCGLGGEPGEATAGADSSR
jgi:hypothetical protein